MSTKPESRSPILVQILKDVYSIYSNATPREIRAFSLGTAASATLALAMHLAPSNPPYNIRQLLMKDNERKIEAKDIPAKAPDQGIRDLEALINAQIDELIDEEVTLSFIRRNIGGQNPHILYVGCSDSFCAGPMAAIGKAYAPNRVFKEDNVGNTAMMLVFDPKKKTPMVDGTAAVNYFLDKIVPHGIEHDAKNKYVVMVEGHTDCGAMYALLEGQQAINALAPGLRQQIKFLYDELHSSITDIPVSLALAQRNALLAQANVDYQVMQIARRCKREIATGQVTLIGAVRDVKGIFDRSPGQDQQIPYNRIYIVNFNGVKDPSAIRDHLNTFAPNTHKSALSACVQRYEAAPNCQDPKPAEQKDQPNH